MLGERLRMAREEKGISLDEVAGRTRIHRSYLEALEAERWSEVPSAVSARGFLRNYLRFLGLPEKELLQQFSEETKTTPFREQRVDPPGAPFYIERWSVSSRGNSIKIGIAAVIGGVLFLAVLTSRESEVRPEKEARPANPQVVPEPSLPSVPSDPSFETFASGRAAVPAPSPLEKLTLALQATEPTWVQVIIDGGAMREALLRPGERVNWQADERFFLTVGNAGGVRVFFQGAELAPLGPSGEKVIREFSRSETQ